MGNIQGKFADQDSYVLTAQVQVSNNNSTALQATITETNHLQGSAVIFQPTGLLATPSNPVPNVTTTAQSDIGAALGDVGQAGTPAQQPGGGGNPPCFIGISRIATPAGDVQIQNVELGMLVWGFDEEGNRAPQRVIGKRVHFEPSYTLVQFEDGHATGLREEHKYWTRPGYAAIKDLDSVWHWSHNAWVEMRITGRTIVKGEVAIYNLTVEGTHNYIVNGDAVSNLCPLV